MGSRYHDTSIRATMPSPVEMEVDGDGIAASGLEDCATLLSSSIGALGGSAFQVCVIVRIEEGRGGDRLVVCPAAAQRCLAGVGIALREVLRPAPRA